MARERKKITAYKQSPVKVVLLLVQFILVKLGQMPLWLIKFTVDRLQGTVKLIFSFRFPHYTLKPVTYTLPHFHRGPGRPRTTPLFPFYLRRFKKGVWGKISQRTKIVISLSGLVLMLYLYTTFILSAAYQLPSPTKLISTDKPLTTQIFDRNGTLLYRLYEGRNRSLVTLSELPPYLIQATIAAEDKNFYRHSGIDLEAIIRALYHNQKDHHLEGASTITQQLVKNSLLTPEKTYSRKIKEIILSLWAEKIYSKDQILQMYFNETPYGGPTWGIKAASQTYFGKVPKDLTLSEASFLVGLPASPTEFSPYGSHPELGLDRQKQVLKRMVENKYLTQKQADEALSENLAFKDGLEDIKAPHFVFYIKDLLSQKYGSRFVSQAGLKVTTTLDLTLQSQVEKIVKEEVEKLAPLNVQNGAAMILDSKTGQILAMVGSRDYAYKEFGNYNATLALRQPGSSIKVITYTEAFKQGFSPGNTILDAPVTFKDEWGNAYSPQNYDGTYHGPISLRTALGSSLNTPAVRTLASVGLDNMIQTAKDLGITTFDDPKRYGLSLTLGGGEVKMMEMMGVYDTFSQMGRLNPPTGILQVTDSQGNLLEEYADHSRKVLQPEIAYLITSILSDNNARSLAFGPNSLLNIPNQVVAVKTGTSDNKRDNWTFGFTKDFVIGVWVGNNDNSPMNPQLTSGITGAAPIWNKITRGLLADHPGTAFLKPSGIVEATIDGRRDLAIAGNIPKGLVRVRNETDKTVYFDAFSSYATPSAQAAIKDGATN